MQAAGPQPAIKKPTAAGMNKGLVECLSDISRGCYADVIVQFVCSIPSDKTPGMPCLLVWDGSEWPHKLTPLITVEGDERPERHPSDPALKEKAKGRMVTIFSYDFDNQCKRPIVSGDWLYLENVHCAYPRDSASSSLVMHNNIRQRQIWRLDLPVANGQFYAKTWQKSMQRVRDAQPLPAAVIEEQRRVQELLQPQLQLQQAAARSVSRPISPQRTPSLASLNRLQTMILDKMIREGVRVPTSDDALERVAESTVATMKTEAAAAAAPAAAAAQPAAAPPAAAPVAADPTRAAPSAAPAAAVAPKQDASVAVPRATAAAAAAAASQAATSPKRASSPKFAVPAVPNRPPSKAAAPTAAPTDAPTGTSPKRAARKDAAAAAAATSSAAAPTDAPGVKSPKRAAPKDAVPAGATAPPTVDSRAAAAAPTIPAAAAPNVTSPTRAAGPKSAAVAAPPAVLARGAKVALPPAASTVASSRRLQQLTREQHCPKSQEVETDAAAETAAITGPTTRAAAAAANDVAGQSPTRKSTRKRSAPITHPEESGAAPPKRSPRKSNDSHNSTIVIDDSDGEEEVHERRPQVGGKKAGVGRTTEPSKSASPEKKPVQRKPIIRAGTPPPGVRHSSRLHPKVEPKKD